MVSIEQLNQLYPRASQANLTAFANQSADLFARFNISDTTTRRDFFLAQIGHESGGLSILVENLNYSAQRLVEVWPTRFPSIAAAAPFAGNPEALANEVYANRMGNGPPASGDGFRYRGRGYIQLTGRDGYRSVGAAAGLDLEQSPDLAATADQALLATCAFWRWKDLNAVCDTGDFTAVTKRINGGVTGLADRTAWLNKVRRVFAEPPLLDSQPPVAEIIAIQKALQDKGFTEVGAADGLIGPHTLSAIARYRQENGMPAGGVDDDLAARLNVA